MNWPASLCFGSFRRPLLVVLTFLIISPRLFALTSKITDTPYFLQEGFGPTGQLLPGDGTSYCAPTSTSDTMVWLARNGLPQLAPAVDQQNRTQQENANLVLSLAGLFNTTPASGTVNFGDGLEEYLRLKGLAVTDFSLTYAGSGNPTPIPTLDYLLSVNQGLSAVILNIQWYNNNFQVVGGHFIALLAVNTATNTLTVSNPFPVTTPNPQVQPMSVIKNPPPTLTGFLQFDDEISGFANALAVLQYSTALQITNPPSADTPAAPYDISGLGTLMIPTNGAILTVEAPITGTGELLKTQPGTVSLANALTQHPSSNAYRYSGGTSIGEGTVISFEANGTPVGTGFIQMVASSTLSLQPVATHAPVSLSLASGLGAAFNFGPGSILELNRGSNASLSVSIGGATNQPNLVPSVNGTLLIKPSDGLSGLGTTTIVKVNGALQNLPPVTNTIVSPAILAIDTDSTGQFLTYNPAANGFKVANYASGNLVSAGANAVYAALTPQILSTNATVYALKLQNVAIQGVTGVQTLTIGEGASNQVSGVILNGGSITNLKLAFGAAQATIFTSQAGGTMGAGISGTAGLVKFGPGNLTLSGRNSYIGSTVIASGKLTINNGSTPGIGAVAVYSGATLTGNGAILGNVTLNSGATRTGACTISGNVEIGPGATFSGGGVVYGNTTVNGFLTPIGVAGGILFNGSITVGQNGILVWNLNKLTDSSTSNAVPGIDFSFFRALGRIDLGVSGGILLQFAPGLSPDKSLPFWTQRHTWTIATASQPIGWTSAFTGLYEPLYKDGSFSWNNVKLAGGGYALQLYYSPTQ